MDKEKWHCFVQWQCDVGLRCFSKNVQGLIKENFGP